MYIPQGVYLRVYIPQGVYTSGCIPPSLGECGRFIPGITSVFGRIREVYTQDYLRLWENMGGLHPGLPPVFGRNRGGLHPGLPPSLGEKERFKPLLYLRLWEKRRGLSLIMCLSGWYIPGYMLPCMPSRVPWWYICLPVCPPGYPG